MDKSREICIFSPKYLFTQVILASYFLEAAIARSLVLLTFREVFPRKQPSNVGQQLRYYVYTFCRKDLRAYGEIQEASLKEERFFRTLLPSQLFMKSQFRRKAGKRRVTKRA